MFGPRCWMFRILNTVGVHLYFWPFGRWMVIWWDFWAFNFQTDSQAELAVWHRTVPLGWRNWPIWRLSRPGELVNTDWKATARSQEDMNKYSTKSNNKASIFLNKKQKHVTGDVICCNMFGVHFFLFHRKIREGCWGHSAWGTNTK